VEFDAKEFRAARADYERNWHVLDGTLYDVCRRFRSHADRAHVCGKLWLIGRTYASGIERLVKSKGTQGSSLAQMADLFMTRSDQIDALVARLDRCRDPLTVEQLKEVVEVHGEFVTLMRPILRKEKCPRSFATKYLHFHCPRVPIYDGYAERVIKKHVRWRKDLEVFDISKGADDWYAWFIMRFWRLFQQAEKTVGGVTARHLDYYLIWMAQSSYTTNVGQPIGKA
jgi:hypothetical protein